MSDDEDYISEIDCPVLKGLILRPFVRFQFFPHVRYMVFKNFSDVQERIDRGMMTFEIAQLAGWDRVLKSMQGYQVMPNHYFADPRKGYLQLISTA